MDRGYADFPEFVFHELRPASHEETTSWRNGHPYSRRGATEQFRTQKKRPEPRRTPA